MIDSGDSATYLLLRYSVKLGLVVAAEVHMSLASALDQCNGNSRHVFLPCLFDGLEKLLHSCTSHGAHSDSLNATIQISIVIPAQQGNGRLTLKCE